MTHMKKKSLIFSLAVTMVLTNTSFSMLRIYGEDENATVVSKEGQEEKVVGKEETKKGAEVTVGVKALLTDQNKITGRNEDNTTDTTEITDLKTISDLMIGDQVTSIEANKFEGLKNITTLTFKAADKETTQDGGTSKVKTIGANAFKGTGITSVVLPKNLTDIEEGAFADTVALTTVSFIHSTSLQNIKTGAFENSGLTALDLKPINTDTTATLNVDAKAFKGNKKLLTATLSSKMTTLESEVFASTGLTTFEIGQNVVTVHATAFKGTPLTTLTVKEGNSAFVADENVLYNSEKTKVLLYPEGKTDREFTIVDTVTEIGPYAFRFSPTLTKVTMNATLTSIGEYAFYGAASLATLDLRKASALTMIKENAFKDSALRSMIIGKRTGLLNTITAGAFDSTATRKLISFLEDTDEALTEADVTKLMEKYKALKSIDNGVWVFNVKLPTPEVVIDYDKMKLTGFNASARYTIEDEEYIADGNGNVPLLKNWGGKTISIVRKAALGQVASDAKRLTIKGIYTVSVDGKETSVKEEGATVRVSALQREGYVFATWTTSDVPLVDPKEKTISFTMPASDVNVTAEYTKIVVETPAAELLFDGTNDVVVTLTSPAANVEQVAVDTIALKKDKEYTVTGTNTTVITLKTAYLDSLSDATTFVVTFSEGGDIAFRVGLYGPAPTALANYEEMKITNLEANQKYSVNSRVVTTDAQGNIALERAWGGHILEIRKVGVKTETDSKPQRLPIETFYAITVDGKEVMYTIAKAKTSFKAETKDGYKFTGWTAKGVILSDDRKEEITFEMPNSDVALTTKYTQILATKAEDIVYDGTNEVIVRLELPIEEFKDVEYKGHKLIRNEDYIVTSGSTILTFTKTFLNQMKEDKMDIRAVFLKDTVTFTIKYVGLPPTKHPDTPTKASMPNTNVSVKRADTTSPPTGDSTNMFVLFVSMIVSAGTWVVVKKRNKQYR